MKVRLFAVMLATLTALLTASLPQEALATDVTVTTTPATGQFSKIQDAINYVYQQQIQNPNASFRILVEPGTYTTPFTTANINSRLNNVPIMGTGGPDKTGGTANTFISGTGIMADLGGSTGVTLSNFTFKGGASISLSGSTSVTIDNIVFATRGTGADIEVGSGASASIINNTFYNALTGISSSASDTLITNNIFDLNGTAISAPGLTTTPSYNAFYNTAVTGVPNTTNSTSLPNTAHPGLDPLFVNAAAGDFHLQAASPCKNAGNPNYKNKDGSISDIGAYGGPNADTPVVTPSIVTGVTATGSGSSIAVNWNASTDKKVTVYRVYYGKTSGNYNGTDATNGASPIEVAAPATTVTLNGLSSATPPPPAAPTMNTPVSLSGGLRVSWSPVSGATSYKVYYSTTNIDSGNLPATSITVAAPQTSVTISGLTNGTTYNVAVQAVAENQYFIAVTAVYDNTITSAPNSANESPYSIEQRVTLGSPAASPLSNQVSDFPEAASPFPNLKGGGCFIATAAYGFYSAPQVQALRIFRDRYLMTNAPGRAFVAWYYHYGPYGARFITEHPWLKPPVRVLLFPLILMAIFLVYTPPLVKTAVIMIAVVVSVSLYQKSQRKLVLQSGGMW